MRGLEHVEVDQTVVLHIQIRDFEAFAFEFAAGVEHGLVLGLHRDDVLALALVEVRRALDGQVVRLRGARGPDDFARIGIDQRGDVLARFFDRTFRVPAI